MIMIRVIKQYGISILLLIVAIFCLFNIGQNIQDAFTVITNSLAIFLAIFYFVNFERDIIIKIKGFILNIKWPFHGQTKKILINVLNFIVEKRWDIISYLFLFLLLIIALGQFSYLEKFIDLAWINKYQVIITVLAILSGGLTFWHNRERVEKEIDREQITEQIAEDKRKTEFADKFPRINKIPIIKKMVCFFYKEGVIYSFLLLIIIIMSSILTLYFINKVPFHIDEAYTNLSVSNIIDHQKFYGETSTGIAYNRNIVYSLIESFFYRIFDDIFYQLRFFNVVLKILLSFLIYILIKNIFKLKKIALLGVFLFGLNWYFILYSMIAREYVISAIILITGILIGKKIYESNNLKDFLISSLLFLLITFSNIFIGHNIGLFSLILLYSMLVFNKLIRDRKNVFYITISLLLILSLFLVYIIFYDNSIYNFIIRNITFKLSNHLQNIINIFYYQKNIGLIIIILITIINLFKKDKFLKILLAWIVGLIILLGYVFGKNILDVRYLFPISFMLVAIMAYGFYFVRLQVSKIIFYFIFIVFIISNLYNLNLMKTGYLGWTIEASVPWNNLVAYIPKESTVIIEYPLVGKLFNFSRIYKAKYHLRDTEIISSNGSFQYPKYNYTEDQIDFFKNYIAWNNNKYIIEENQDWDIYTGSPVIMNDDHLDNILLKEKNVYAILTYDSYKHKDSNPVLRSIIENGEIVQQFYPKKNLFNDQKSKLNIYPILTLIRLN